MDAKSFVLEIIRPTSAETINVAWLEVESPTGSFVIGPQHSPLISLLKRKTDLIYQIADGPKIKIDVFGGLLRVQDDRVIVLLDS